MRSQGSVLIVVLGLLAILAVVGVTFVSLSSMDRTTASNFALQSQFMLAADGAVDYVCDHLVKDLWQYNTQGFKGSSTVELDDPYGDNAPPLLSDLRDIANTRGTAGAKYTWDHNAADFNRKYGFVRNEPWDFPGPEDPWLGTTLDWDTLSALCTSAPAWFQYSDGATASPNAYGLTGRWGQTAATTDAANRANNLGIPGGDADSKSLAFTSARRATHVDPYWPPNGVWIPDISFPYETGLIRVSVTVQDHGGMINVNVHGNDGLTGAMSSNKGKGYFISDVKPLKQATGIDFSTAYLKREYWRCPSATAGNANTFQMEPENPRLAGSPPDRPFTLEEELELRRYTGTSYQSRLEQLAAAADSVTFVMDPAQILSRSRPNETGIKQRLGLTTVSWTSEIRPDPWVPFELGTQSTSAPVPLGHPNTASLGPNAGYQGRKADPNLDSASYIFKSLWYGRVFLCDDSHPPTSAAVQTELLSYKQFCADIAGFRDGALPDRVAIRDMTNDIRLTGSTTFEPAPTTPIYCASRQPMFSKLRWTSSSDANNTTYEVEYEIFSPWGDNCVSDPQRGLSLSGFQVVAYPKGTATITKNPPALPVRMPVETGNTPGSIYPESLRVRVPLGAKLTDGLRLLKITYNTAVDVDYIDDSTYGATLTKLDTAGQGTILYRPIYVAYTPTDTYGDERNGSATDKVIRVVYVGDWTQNTGGTGTQEWKKWTQPAVPPQPGAELIPIRFPNSCRITSTGAPLIPDSPKGLPIKPIDTSDNLYTTSGKGTFKAFARLGDLNQVLLFKDTTVQATFWPWLPRLAYGKSASNQALTNKDVKFTWQDTNTANTASVLCSQSGYSTKDGVGTFSPLFAANVLCTGGPWSDRIDNDGDGATDDGRDTSVTPADTGETGGTSLGRFGGPEIRVAGKVNLNTASQATVQALENGLGLQINSLWTGVDAMRKAVPARRFITPAVVLADKENFPDLKVGTSTDADEQRREAYNRLSNIVTTRSDTYSIYGTVQFVDTSSFLRKGATKITPYVRRTRRFWALVDRSPSAACAPNYVAGYTHPRILNFQWMD